MNIQLLRSPFSCMLICLIALTGAVAQPLTEKPLWHDKERSIHYLPEGKDFVCTNGKFRFNRALYGTNTGFRVEAGDLPEFALYMPGMGGNFKLGLVTGSGSKWVIQAENIKAIYRPGSMHYEITDPFLGKGMLKLDLLALGDREGMILKATFINAPSSLKLCWVYGGATGEKFSRDGDIGADPESSFYLKPEYCKTNSYSIEGNRFVLSYGSGTIRSEAERYEIKENQKVAAVAEKVPQKQISGVFPEGSQLHTADATALSTPENALASVGSAAPVITGSQDVSDKSYYFLLQNSALSATPAYTSLPVAYLKAEAARMAIAGRCEINTPDVYINNMGNALAIAADAVWESPSFMHGAVAWRMRLNGWRGAYLADPLGWHDRAEEHFNAYEKSQVLFPLTGPVVADTALHLARQLEKMGTSLFSSGYISRNPNNNTVPHHYDMNLVFIDQVLNHFNYTGDLAYVKKMWPMLERHLAWEKRNFDADGDGLYDSYAALWASDALQYSGGGVTHSSAYNYKANKMAAMLARMIGYNPAPYSAEAGKILAAMKKQLWLKDKGWYAEYKDLLGRQMLHPAAALWTVYHTLDSWVPDNFEAYQMLRYVDNEIPHIPVRANGLKDDGMYLLSTTNWQPYTWSLNNVVLAENLHTALAYWQGNRSEDAFRLWRSAMVESMYLGKSPANIQQISFYDAARGELYRDFADDIGMAARSLNEGLFGIHPDALNGRLIIKPGYPGEWSFASLNVPDIAFNFKRIAGHDTYTIVQRFPKSLSLDLQLNAVKDRILRITVNGKPAKFRVLDGSVDVPVLSVSCGTSPQYSITIDWAGRPIERTAGEVEVTSGKLVKQYRDAVYKDIFDPQNALSTIHKQARRLEVAVKPEPGNKTFFVKLKQGQFSWWQPVCFKISPPAELPGTTVTQKFEKVDLVSSFNDKVTSIFKNQYLSPRPKSATLQLPVQGIGNWAYPLTEASIDDSGLRKLAGGKDEIVLPGGVPFATPHETGTNNILFTSQWDNYPREQTIPLNGRSSHAWLLMAGSTNPMQSRLANGEIVANYADGSSSTLLLVNPDNWWPIEQDYMIDGYAFTAGKTRPWRVHLKSGMITDKKTDYSSIKGFSNMAIDGGAATVVDLVLDKGKELKSLTLRTLANDVVIGLMAVTLER